MKSDCLCTVNASKYAALEGWWGTCSRYWYTAAERKKKKHTHTHILRVSMGLVGSSSSESDPVVTCQIS